MQQLMAYLPLTGRTQDQPSKEHFAATFLLLMIFLYSFAVKAETTDTPTVIGHVTLALGQSVIEKADGGQFSVRMGDVLHPGDTLITRSSGYLHLKFVDNALLSMRPESKLSIDKYHYDVDSPELSAVRFNLQEGMARSVSGEAAKQDHQKFRLNTPIAAIGVRGTDFTVLADNNRVRTFVSEGAIVVSPFSDACQSLTLGPCGNNGVELKGNSNLLVELDSVSVRPQLLQLGLKTPPTSNMLMDDSVIAQLSRVPAHQNSGETEGQTDNRIAINDNTDARKATSISSTQTNVTSENSPNADDTSNNSNRDGDHPASGAPDSSLLAMDGSGTNNTNSDSNTISNGDGLLMASHDNHSQSDHLTPGDETVSEQFEDHEIGSDIIPKDLDGISFPDILWSYQPPVPPKRFNAPDFVYTDTLVSAAISRDAINKHPVFSNERFTLYRPDELYDSINPIRPNPGSVGFQLQQGAAFYFAKGQQFDLNLDSGKLLIDFEKGKFSTALQMSHQETGQISFSSSGDVTPSGLFSSEQPDHTLSGAVSLDTENAGYYFEQSVPNLESKIDGITTWQVPNTK